MRALIMAGGQGSRINRGEKPLLLIRGRPMISYVIDAFSAAGTDPVVAASKKTPMTMNWCRAQGIDVFRAEGKGFIDDMIEAVTTLEEQGPLFVYVSDLPCITAEIIQNIANEYRLSGKDACSAWVPAHIVQEIRCSISYLHPVNGVDACPAGVNILRGDLISRQQDEIQVLLNDPGLALNVNTPDDLAIAAEFLKRRAAETGGGS